MVTFSYPYPVSTVDVTIRNPELNDSRIRWPKTKMRWSMSNVPHTFLSKPINKFLNLTFRLMVCGDEMTNLLDFLELSAGEIFHYRDHLSFWPLPTNKVKLVSGSLQVSRSNRGSQLISFQLEIVP